MKFFLFLNLFIISISHANQDEKLKFYIEQFKFAPVPVLENNKPYLFKLGEKLFFDNKLSLKENISCSTCHHPEHGSGDALSFSIGQGGEGQGTKRIQHQAGLTSRNAPALYNKGFQDFTHMFWDGRVRYYDYNQSFRTPEPGLNGKEPPYKNITSKMTSALAAQALFPMVNQLEMRGDDLNHLSNYEVWEIIAKKIIASDDYTELLKLNFGENWDQINIGDIAEAIAYYESRAFQITNTPWDQYLRGNLNALTEKEKRGAIIFADKARCANCHHGTHLTNFSFQNIGIPPIAPNGRSQVYDLGHYDIMPQQHMKYTFLTPPLRQISKTAPYFHNGTFLNLKDVINHYLKPKDTMDFFQVDVINETFKLNYNLPLIDESNLEIKKEIQENVHPLIKNPVNLSLEEQDDLLYFLEKSLTETKNN